MSVLSTFPMGSTATGGSSVQPDWNQNYETASDYIKNRTHYPTVIRTTTFESQELTFTNGECLVDFADTDKSTYDLWDYGGRFVLTLDGTDYYYAGGGFNSTPEYENTPITVYRNLAEADALMLSISSEVDVATSTHKISIAKIADSYKKLGMEYLPFTNHKSLYLSESADSWVDNTLTVEVEGVTADNTVIVSPDPDCFSAWGAAGIRCTAQDENSLTFNCDTPPSDVIWANILIVG